MKRNEFGSLPIKSSEITPEHLYLSRRKFMKLAGMVGITAALAACSPGPLAAATQAQPTPTDQITSSKTEELNAPLTPYEAITN